MFTQLPYNCSTSNFVRHFFCQKLLESDYLQLTVSEIIFGMQFITVCCISCIRDKSVMMVVRQIADLANEDTPQMYTLCGRGPRSSLRVLRHGLEVTTYHCFLDMIR